MTSLPGKLLATGLIGAGLAIVAVASGLIEPDPGSVHAPSWVLGLCGVVFIGGGAAVLFPSSSRWRSIAAGSLVVSMGIIAGWVALFGPGEHMSGGFWFVPHDTNVWIGRIVFGLGSLMCFAIAAWALFGKHDAETD